MHDASNIINRLDKPRSYLHVDQCCFSVMGSPELNDNIIEFIQNTFVDELNKFIKGNSLILHDIPYSTEKHRGWNSKAELSYQSGAVTIWFNRKFQGKQKIQPPKDQRLMAIQCTTSDNLNADAHHRTLQLLCGGLKSYELTKNFHVSHVELALDTYDEEIGSTLFRTMVPLRADRQGWGFPKSEDGSVRKEKVFLPGNIDQYYFGATRSWHCYQKQSEGITIYRIELELKRQYLKSIGIDNAWELFLRRTELFKNNVAFMEPNGSAVKRYFRNKGRRLYVQPGSTCEWMHVLKQEIGAQAIQRYFCEVLYPQISTEPLWKQYKIPVLFNKHAISVA